MFPTVLLAQESEGVRMVKYTPEFKFRNGLYLNIEMLKANQPLPFSRIVTDHNKYDKKFFDDLIAQQIIIFYDDNGVETSIVIKDTWGYALNGRLYLMLGSRFQQITIEGAISLFLASATTSERVQLSVGDGQYPKRTGSSTIVPYRNVNSYVTVKDRRYLFDFESNELKGYHFENLEGLLKRDLELYTEYTSLRRRQKNRMMLTFIRRYNEKHPLYFPFK